MPRFHEPVATSGAADFSAVTSDAEAVVSLPPDFDGSVVSSIHHRAIESFFAIFERFAEGALVVDRHARITWIDDKYLAFLGLPDDADVIGRHIRDVVPGTRMPEVLREGRPIPFDIMEARSGWCVVSRFPLFDDSGSLIGGFGFVMYPDLEALAPIYETISRLRSDRRLLRSTFRTPRRSKYTFAQFVGTSAPAMAVKRQAKLAAAVDSTVLLCGETGSGKELLAQAIHAASSRADRNFVGLNLAAIPEELMEAELFGAKYGAYTGADRDGRVGKLALANGGTLFLDEVSDISPRIQVKLLRALQEREIEPLGSNAVAKIDVRLLAATSKDLGAVVEQGQFRLDLYYRLNVVKIDIPPLRARATDIPLLCDVLLRDVCAAQRIRLKRLDRAAIELLQAQDWPGNVRQLRNVLEQACVLCHDKEILQAMDFATALDSGPGKRASVGSSSRSTLSDVIAKTEKAVIADAWKRANGNKVMMSKLLGISRSNLYKKLATYGIV